HKRLLIGSWVGQPNQGQGPRVKAPKISRDRRADERKKRSKDRRDKRENPSRPRCQPCSQFPPTFRLTNFPIHGLPDCSASRFLLHSFGSENPGSEVGP